MFGRALATYRVKMALLLLFLLAVIAGQGGIGAFNIHRMYLASQQMFETSLKSFNTITDILYGFKSAHAELLLALQHSPDNKWATSHDHPIERHLDKAEADLDDVRSALKSLQKINIEPKLKNTLDQLAKSYDDFEAAANDIAKAMKEGAFERANEIILKRLNPAAKIVAEAGQKIEVDLLEAASRQDKESEKNMRQVLIATAIGVLGSVLISAIVGIGLGRSINRQITTLNDAFAHISNGDLTHDVKPSGRSEFDLMLERLAQMQKNLRFMMTQIRHNAELVAMAATDTQAGTRDAIVRSNDLQDSVRQSSAAMAEMNDTIARVSQSVAGVDTASADVTQLSQEGGVAMDRNIATVETIVNSVENTSQIINELKESTRRISELAAFIREIADQTNLLALNAAIEAARAGEQGRGFAVVADEVRKLAEKTTASSNDIAQVLDNVSADAVKAVQAMQLVLTEVRNGAESTHSANEKLKGIVAAAQHVSQLTHAISEAAGEQSGAAQKTASNMDRVSSITEENNSVINMIGTHAANLASIASQLQTAVSQFRVS